jgi:hypothetical protein
MSSPVPPSHERLSLDIATDDLRYVSGTVLAATVSGAHPRVWPFTQWGSMVAFEARKHLEDVHSRDLRLPWDSAVAEASRHSNKFFDDTRLLVDGTLDRFSELLASNRRAFFPDDRLRMFDGLRDDLSVIVVNGEVVLTNVSGLFMMGTPASVAAELSGPGPYAMRLSQGIGAAAAAFTGLGYDDLIVHGNHDAATAVWSDAKSDRALGSAYGGRLGPNLSIALMTIQSAVQSARFWANASCCDQCHIAALKHRFVVTLQAMRSMRALSETTLDSRSREWLGAILGPDPDAGPLLTAPFRRLRNGWMHLGIGDVAESLPADPQPSDLVRACTGLSLEEFARTVDASIEHFARTANAWLADPGPDGSTIFDHLHPAS